MNIDLFAKHWADETYMVLTPSAKKVTNLLISVFKTSKVDSFHKKVLKAILKPALCMSYFDVELPTDLLFDDYSINTSETGSSCLRCYAWLENYKYVNSCGISFPSDIPPLIHELFVKTSTKYSNDTRYFALAIENYIIAYDIKIYKKNFGFAFTVVLTNLENSHQNVHKLLLELFKRMVRSYSEKRCDDLKMIEDIIELPWTNRNKYSLLAIIVSQNCQLLLNHEKFNMSSFLEGIQVGLTIHHLLANSQTLVKAALSEDAFKFSLMELISKILWQGEDEVAQNVIKYWLSTFDSHLAEKLFVILAKDGKLSNVPTTSKNFFRILLLRNAFKRSFKDPELDATIRAFACDIEGTASKVEIFHILIDAVYTEADEHQRLANILSVLNFVRFNMCIEDSGFIEQHVMRKLPDFFNLLASRKLRNVKVLEEIFAIIKVDLFDAGIKLSSYQSQTFSLKLLSVILKQYCGADGARLSKNTNIEGNLSFGKYLKENQIWDLTSSETFENLVTLIEHDENSDVSEMGLNLLVEYFIKRSIAENYSVEGLKFIEWVDKKIAASFNETEISSGTVANRHFILKIEYLMNKNLCAAELLSSVDLLKTRFMKLKADSDPVRYMEEGMHLFKLMDCINYGVKRLKVSDLSSDADKSFIAVLSVLNKMIASHFLDYISDLDVPPSFEILDEKLTNLLEASSPDSLRLKSKLLLFIWFTIRSAAELTESLAAIVDAIMKPYENKYVDVMTTCVDINIHILARCCHKGAIDSGSTAIGKITKIIAKRYSTFCKKTSSDSKNLHTLLVTLKREIDCGVRPSSDCGDIRSSRGLIVMSYQIISNHPPFLKFLMEKLLVIPIISSFDDTQRIQFIPKIKPIQLHLLAMLIKSGDLVETMLKQYDYILVATFKMYKESKDFVVINALLQLVGAIVPKIANQKSHLMSQKDDEASQYEPKAVTVYEFYVKFTFSFRIALYDLDVELHSLSTTYIIILLEIMSNFEHRNEGEHWSEMERMANVFEELRDHDCEKIRFLAAKCEAQWQEVDKEISGTIERNVPRVFSNNSNIVHYTVHYVRFMIQRFESCVNCVKAFDSEEFKKTLRAVIAKEFESSQGFIGAQNFYIRYHLLEFLLFLGFQFQHDVVQSLMFERGLTSHLGYKLWADKLKQLQDKSV